MRTRAALLTLGYVITLCGCGRPSGTSPSGTSDYGGTWTGIQPHSIAQNGIGVTFVVSGQAITSAAVTTENYFGFAPAGAQAPPGCALAFSTAGPATITGSSFTIPLQLTATPMASVSNLEAANTASFVGTPILQGTFASTTTASGQLNYTISSATCGGTTYAGTIPTPGYGNQLRSWTASK